MAAMPLSAVNARDQAEIDSVADDLAKARLTATGVDEKPVPVNYSRHGHSVPVSMKENHFTDWRELPETQIEILPEYGPEHDELVRLRTDLEGMKRTINGIGPILEARLRCAMKLKNEDLSEEDKVMVLTQDADAKNKRDASFESLKFGLEKTKDEITRTRLEPVIAEILEGGSKDFNTKDEYATFWTFLRSQTQKIFAEQKKLLERIKAIKRGVAAQHQAAQSTPSTVVDAAAQAAPDVDGEAPAGTA